MKQLFLLLAYSAIAIAVVSCNQAGKNQAAGSGSGSSIAGIVYVNSDTLLAKYNFSIDQNKIYKATADSMQNIFQQREAAFQNEVESYQKMSNTLTAEERGKTEAILGQKQQELQQLQQVFQQQASEKQLELTKALSKKLQDFLKGYSTNHNYKMVLIYSELNSGILYGDPSLDVTADVLKELNAAYPKK